MVRLEIQLLSTESNNKVGLSLSFCIKDIINGLVQEDDVEYIIAGTCASTPDQWDKVLDPYCRIYWKDDPKKAREIAYRFLKEGKIKQPRLSNDGMSDNYNISLGHWVDSEKGMELLMNI
jgi:hypothetical protein